MLRVARCVWFVGWCSLSVVICLLFVDVVCCCGLMFWCVGVRCVLFVVVAEVRGVLCVVCGWQLLFVVAWGC